MTELISVRRECRVPVLPSGLKDRGVLPVSAAVKISSPSPELDEGEYSVEPFTLLLVLAMVVDTAESRER